ncbi:winged helix-turn-helix domain-containing protein [Kaustia mangrovi]|uniref:winged helix-turn-helix domain-containing protein n=1 Tax=Kaustia mangrovi TaxID=2593653 RepID=UPI001FE78A91|nr:crosslink repair DNA glycosylase YcaQ family protein [Kaustia mangrovi]
MAEITLTNRQARHLFLDGHGLSDRSLGRATADRVLETVRALGFVQLDSINTVERAHHMILYSRLTGYRRSHLDRLHGKDAALFEHWTHDASLIPVEYFPHWRHRFDEARERLEKPVWRARLGDDAHAVIRAVHDRVAREGPLMARDFDDAHKGEGAWWGWGPSKTALEYLWRAGALAIARRERFEKVYDLTERVIPDEHRSREPSRAETVDWACREALARLGFATHGELAAFWDLVSPEEARAWAEAENGRDIVEIAVEGADGRLRKAWAFNEIEGRLDDLAPPSKTLRLVSPFDPAIRDRRRAERLFGFDYRIEVFVPANKRTYGYYVLPILEGDRFVGRIDLKAHRGDGVLEARGLWLEPRMRLTPSRETGLRRALDRLARFAELEEVRADEAFGRCRRGEA